MKNEITKFAKKENAIIGFASVERFDNINKENHPRYFLNKCETVIVLGVKVSESEYFADNNALHFIQRSNHITFNILDTISFKIANYLEDKDFKSIPVPSFAPMKMIKNFPHGLLSLKNAAAQAGLGNLGKNDIVYNDKYGGFIRFSAILTEAKIEPDVIKNKKICDDNCMICIKSCPANAITKKGYNNRKCFKYTFHHGLMPIVLFNLTKIEKLVNTSFYNYWLNCCECTIKCPLNKKY